MKRYTVSALCVFILVLVLSQIQAETGRQKRDINSDFATFFSSKNPLFQFNNRRDPKANEEVEVGCGTKAIDPTKTYKISTPFFNQGPYPYNYNCNWEFFGTEGCIPRITCPTFDIRQSDNCAKDSLTLSDGSDASQKWCGTAGPNATSSDSILIATFRSGSPDFPPSATIPKGFQCLITCAPKDSQSQTTLVYQPPKTTDCKCGVPGAPIEDPAPQRIVGGVNATKGVWRWMAAMVPKGRKNPFCGGSLINDRFILTAAHCVVTTGIAAFPNAMDVILNEYDLSKANETQTLRIGVSAITPHPFYDPQTQDYDVAILQLSTPVNLLATEEPKVTPVCLPARNSYLTYTGEPATIIGWGTLTEGGDQPDVLQYAQVPVISNDDCNKQYEGKITPRMICAMPPGGGTDSCQGDSGGPMTFNNTDQRFNEIGIVSFGQGCARADKAGVYSRVTDLNDWIRFVTKTGTWCQE